MEGLRTYDGWWYAGPFEDPPNDNSGQRSPKPPQDSASVLNNWVPFHAHDNDRLENAYHDVKFRHDEDEFAVHDATGHTLAKVVFSKMKLEPLYWEGFTRPIRRSTWVLMKSNRDIEGGTPVAADWDEVLEETYSENASWLNSGHAQNVVEKIVKLRDPLSHMVLVLRQGVPESAYLMPKTNLESKGPIDAAKLRLIRGYLPYYIAVNAAIQLAESEKNPKSPSTPSCPLPSPFTSPDLDPPEAPKHLVFAIHGIGQRFAGRRGESIVTNCNDLREKISQAIFSRDGTVEDVLVLPVNWRRGLNLGFNYSNFATNQDQSITFEDLVSMITLNNIPTIREVAADVGLDILLYMTPAYFNRIIQTTLHEIHRIYRIFRKSYGETSSQTKVSFVGHSLGAAIASDLISFTIPEDEDPESLKSSYESVVRNLGFKVFKFFAIGSPVPIFLLLKQLQPVGCYTEEGELSGLASKGEKGEDSKYPSLTLPDESDGIMNPQKMMYACKEIYNIFHPYDPIAYRMEPLLVSPVEMPKYLLPVKLPYHKKGALHLKRQMEAQVQALQDAAIKKKDSLLGSLPSWLRPKLTSPNSSPQPAEEPVGPSNATTTTPAEIKPLQKILGLFNHHNRVDFQLEEPLLENAYISALSCHMTYWEDVDIAHFMVLELLAGLPVKLKTTAV